MFDKLKVQAEELVSTEQARISAKLREAEIAQKVFEEWIERALFIQETLNGLPVHIMYEGKRVDTSHVWECDDLLIISVGQLACIRVRLEGLQLSLAGYPKMIDYMSFDELLRKLEDFIQNNTTLQLK